MSPLFLVLVGGVQWCHSRLIKGTSLPNIAAAAAAYRRRKALFGISFSFSFSFSLCYCRQACDKCALQVAGCVLSVCVHWTLASPAAADEEEEEEEER